MIDKVYNPDILTCFANLSEDEVFTPPEFANKLLDELPKEIWKNKHCRFLDPVSKSGVFLREITKRLIIGLEDQIPNLEERVIHILKNQVFGISITELTGLISRRTLYYSKKANGKNCVINHFQNDHGNILFKQKKHTWIKNKCTFCGVSELKFNRDDSLETYAYPFIHDDPNSFFNMKFDVIIGNPPYQVNDGGGMGTSAIPIYQKFVEKAIALNPNYLIMIIPARWYAGGKGLDEFRNLMLNDKRIEKLIDYFDSSISFPGVDISGGVCYFLWNKNYVGDCEVKTIFKDSISILNRPLLEGKINTFIRFNEAISIVRKIELFEEKKFIDIVSARRPFGFSKPQESKNVDANNQIKVYAYPNNKQTTIDIVTQNHELVSHYKVFISKAYGERGDFPYNVLAKPFVGEPNSICSETYLLINAKNSKQIASNIAEYISTKFFRFLVLLVKNTQNAPKSVYALVPTQDFNKKWNDKELYEKYNLNTKEIEFIESMIKPMLIN